MKQACCCLPPRTGELGQRSGEFLCSGGERLCRASSEPLPAGLPGLELLCWAGAVGSVLLPTEMEEEEEDAGGRVGLCC